MTLWPITSPEIAVSLVLSIATIGICVSAAEELYRRDIFGDSGLLSWSVLRYSGGTSAAAWISPLLDRMFAPKAFHAILVLKLFVAAALGLSMTLARFAPLAAGLLSAALLFVLLILKTRTSYGLDGSDHMNIQIFVAAMLFFMSPSDSTARTACVLYIGLQSVLSYTVSGLAKFAGREWRTGTALAGIFSTQIYGRAFAGRFFRAHPRFSRAACWGIIAFQCLFVLTIVGDDRILFLFLAIGAAFHIANAFLMGLGSFVFSFMATYPAVIFLHHWLRIAH
ncbi:MAG: hypothetical protein QOD42_1014 [Sphingomonadales bacterium]|jgi:hypothetical protein|nr:hypothetical protein [Sphingomonadales bacterium]